MVNVLEVIKSRDMKATVFPDPEDLRDTLMVQKWDPGEMTSYLFLKIKSQDQSDPHVTVIGNVMSPFDVPGFFRLGDSDTVLNIVPAPCGRANTDKATKIFMREVENALPEMKREDYIEYFKNYLDEYKKNGITMPDGHKITP